MAYIDTEAGLKDISIALSVTQQITVIRRSSQEFSMLDSFTFIPPFPVTGVSYCRCRYYAEDFSASAFDHYGIRQPAQLSSAEHEEKAAFLAGRYCAKLALINYVGNDDLSRGIELSTNPDLSPKWPRGIVGSITQNGNTAAAAVAGLDEFLGVGIDCENLLPATNTSHLKGKMLSDEDLKRCGTVSMDVDFFTTLAFSAKESLYKALYPPRRQTLDFRDVSIKSVDAKSVTLTLRKTLNSAWKPGTDFEVRYTRQHDTIFTMACIAP